MSTTTGTATLTGSGDGAAGSGHDGSGHGGSGHRGSGQDETGRDWLAVVVGGLRCASGISFLIAPNAANRLWGDEADVSPTAQLLLRSMGYRDALVGGLLLKGGLAGGDAAAPWFLASAGADAADLLGGIGHHHSMTTQQRLRGLGGAVLGIGIGLGGAARARARGRR